jgi:hypothetical protein
MTGVCALTRYTGNGHENAGENKSQIENDVVWGLGIRSRTRFERCFLCWFVKMFINRYL